MNKGLPPRPPQDLQCSEVRGDARITLHSFSSEALRAYGKECFNAAIERIERQIEENWFESQAAIVTHLRTMKL